MPKYAYTVVVEAATEELADRVMSERIGYDEDLGFDYSIDTDFKAVQVANG